MGCDIWGKWVSASFAPLLRLRRQLLESLDGICVFKSVVLPIALAELSQLILQPRDRIVYITERTVSNVDLFQILARLRRRCGLLCEGRLGMGSH